jgi:hypothetical protein
MNYEKNVKSRPGKKSNFPESMMDKTKIIVLNTHRINAVSDFVRRPDSKELEDKNTTFRNLDLFLS